MPGVAYVDASALLKLVVREAETSALEADLAGRDGLVASKLAALECRRAARRTSNTHVLEAVDEVLDALYLLEITTAILDRAAVVDPPPLRSLNAIHLATALSIDEPGLDVITYDRRFADAALASGLRVAQPGR